MIYTLSEPGWFASVNGIPVGHVPLPASLMEHAGTFDAHHGIEIHRQQGPSGDLSGTEIARGYPIATWNVATDGTIRQYNDARIADWHGDSVSRYAFGIENAGFTGTPMTDAQLRSLEVLCAGIVAWNEDVNGETIPLVKVPRISLSNYTTARGFWDHDDVDNGPLNENGHTDKLEGEAWTTFLTNVGKILAPARPAPTFHGTLLALGVDAPDVLVWKHRMSVKRLFELGDANDGPHYGKVIEAATKEFQTKRKLTADGIVGPVTWAAAWTRA